MKYPFVTGYITKEEVAPHFENKHLASASVQYSCALCDISVQSEEELGRHMLDDHCPSSVVDKPLFYRCLGCEAKFKTQYALIKHSCPVSILNHRHSLELRINKIS